MSPEILQFIKYIIVGVGNTVTDLVVFWAFINLFERLKIKEIYKLKTTTISHILSFLCANILSFVLNSAFTFNNAKVNRGPLLYFSVSLVSFLVSSSLIQILATEAYFEKFIKLLDRFSPKFKSLVNFKHYALIIKLCTILITLFTNYFGYKYLVFGQ